MNGIQGRGLESPNHLAPRQARDAVRIKRETASGPAGNRPIKLALNKRLIEGLEPKSTRYYITDTRQPGLTLAVHPSGERSFVFLRKFQGQARRLTIGKFPAVSVAGARDKAKQYLAAIAKGEDPFQQKAAENKRATVGQLCEKYIEHTKAHLKPATWSKYETLYRQHLSKLKNRPATKLTKDDVSAWHLKIAEARTRGRKTDKDKRAVYQANRCLSLLRAALNHSDILPNPCKGVKMFKETSRDRFLKVDELPRLIKALDEDGNQTFADVIRVCLLTGARQSNVRMMKWDQVDIPNRTWRIPDTKSGTPQNVPLSPPAVAILERRKAGSTSEWVFPGRSGESYLRYPKSTWERLLKRAEIEGLRLHDLRRTAGSWMLAGGASLPTIQKTLGHRSITTTMAYARTEDAAVRAAMDAVGAAMFGKGEGGAS